MFDRGASAAAEALIDRLQRLLSCLTPSVFVREFARPGETRVISTGPTPVRLRGAADFSISVLIGFAVTPSVNEVPVARITGYSYEIIGSLGETALVFHWHPASRSPVTKPHIHIGGAVASVSFHKVHVPTGFVSFADVVTMLISELGVTPARQDWIHVLQTSVEPWLSDE